MIRALYVSSFDGNSSAIGLYSDTLTRALEKSGRAEVIRGPLQAADNSGLDRDGPAALAENIRRLAKEQRADLVHIHYEPGLYSPRAVLGLTRMARKLPPLVITLHRVAAYDGRWRLRGVRQARAVAQEWLLARKASCLIVHAEHSAAVLRKRYPKVRTEVQSMPVPDDECDAPRRPNGPVLYYGNHHPGKGILEFVMAMQVLPEIKAIVAGKSYPQWAKYNGAVEREAAKAPNVSIEDGWTSEAQKHALFNGASAVVLPYRALGSGSLVLLEAIAHRRPVVASTAEPLASLVKDLKVGLAVDTRDPDIFAEAIRRLDTQDSRVFAAALERAREQNSGPAVAQRLAAIYEDLLAGKRGGDT